MQYLGREKVLIVGSSDYTSKSLVYIQRREEDEEDNFLEVSLPTHALFSIELHTQTLSDLHYSKLPFLVQTFNFLRNFG